MKTIQIIKEWGELLWFDMSAYFTAIYDEIRLNLAIKLADAKQRAYNKRYFVISDYRNKLTVLNNKDIEWLKKARLMNKNVTHIEIMRDCFYYTPLNKNEEGNKLSKAERLNRKAKWLDYMEKYRSNKNRKKLAKLKQKHNDKR